MICCSETSLGFPQVSTGEFIAGVGLNAYQIAHNDLAVTSGRERLGGSDLATDIAGRLGGLLDSSSRGSRSCASGGATLRSAARAGRGSLLGGGDLVKRLVKLAGHDDGE